jgi:DNA-binding MarR family transcriptional regulator
MAGAFGRGEGWMDSVFFSVKRAHHSVLKFSRRALAGFGITPARFDLLFAVADAGDGITQRALRMILGVARSTISEMLGALERIGLVERSECFDGRTRAVALTKRGRALFRSVSDQLLDSGFVSVTVDGIVSGGDAAVDPYPERSTVMRYCALLRSAFGDFATRELYAWHVDEYLDALRDINDESVVFQ